MSATTLADLLEALGYTEAEHVAICHQQPGGSFAATVAASPDAPRRIASVSDGSDVWYSVNPVQADAAGRGTVAEVTRWAALYADLDAKPGGLPDLTAAQAVVDTLADMLGTAPTALTFSGHGLQPYWALDPADPATRLDDTNRGAAQATLRRFGRLVAAVAERHNGQVDSVYDLARVLRAPGTVNHKNPARPVPVVTALLGGAPLAVEQVLEVLDAYGIPHLSGDDDTPGEQVSDPAGWGWAAATCGYARTMTDGWNGDNPTARHPWFIAQATRLAAAHRNGCLTAADHTKAATALEQRLRRLLATGQVRPLSPGEVADGHAWARARVGAMTDDRLRRELGDHVHLVEPKAPVSLAASRPRIEQSAPERPTVNGNLATVHHLRPVPADLDTLERSEDGHAQALIATYGDVVRYCADRGRWLVWNGTVWDWQPEDGGRVREYAKVVARALPEDDNGAVTHKRKALSSAGTSGALRQARTDPRIAVDINDLDAHAWELNTPGGTIDLRTGQLHPADPTHLHTKVAGCAPDPGADDEMWSTFLAVTFNGDTQLIDYLQRLVGYSAVGEVGPHVLPFCIGSGGNGKGVFLEAVTAVLGDYATTAPAGFLMATAMAKHETELARLAGRRMVLCSEVNEADRFDEAKVKQLTGGDTLTARFMRADHFTFTPTHQLWLMGNHRPEVRAGGDSFWRRLRQIDFKHTVPESARIDGLQRMLADEHGPALLAWIVAGAVAYRQGGLAEPDSVKVATAEYAHDQDTVSRFLEERCHLGGGDHVQLKSAVLRGAYESWCAEIGETPVSAKAFGIALRRAGIEAGRSKASRHYVGIALLAGEGEEETER